MGGKLKKNIVRGGGWVGEAENWVAGENKGVFVPLSWKCLKGVHKNIIKKKEMREKKIR